jgi:hypothetical protein
MRHFILKNWSRKITRWEGGSVCKRYRFLVRDSDIMLTNNVIGTGLKLIT